jgi:hypothetical protein
MTLQQIDQALADWSRRLEAIADNLFSLQAEPAYQSLTGSAGAAKVAVTGETAARVEPALAAMQTMFEDFGSLHATIDRAKDLRKGLPTLFGAEQKSAEIQHLLCGKSIQLPVTTIPLQQRTLLGQAQRADGMCPDDLLATMVQTYAAARDAVLAVDKAWQQLAGDVAHAEEKLDWLRRQPSGLAAQRWLGDAERSLRRAREQIQSDPLGSVGELQQQVDPALNRASQLVAEVLQMQQELTRARTQLDELPQLHREAVEAVEQARAKIVDCSKLPQPAETQRLQHLSDWLDQLEKRLNEGTTEHIAAGLRNWQSAAAEYAAQERNVSVANRAAVEARRELRGRLDALKAKARGRGLAEQGAIAGLAQQAEALLAARPTDMAQAAAAVTAYAKRLNGGLETR